MSDGRPSALDVLRAHGLSPKKSFGQNFLQDPRMCLRIAELALPEPGGTVVELGAGLGALTAPLLERAEVVVAVERDRDLVPILAERFGAHAGFELREADAARLDWLAELRDRPQPWVVAGNLPYQITGKLIEKAVGVSRQIARAVFMVQREVALRLGAAVDSQDYSALSVFTQAAFDVQRALKVSAGAFMPAPKVDSAVVVLTPHAGEPRAVETRVFREVVRLAFGQRRKTLRNAWKQLGGLDRDALEALAVTAGVRLDARAETLAVEDFGRVAAALETLRRGAATE